MVQAMRFGTVNVLKFPTHYCICFPTKCKILSLEFTNLLAIIALLQTGKTLIWFCPVCLGLRYLLLGQAVKAYL